MVALKFFAGLDNVEIAVLLDISELERRNQIAPSRHQAEGGLPWSSIASTRRSSPSWRQYAAPAPAGLRHRARRSRRRGLQRFDPSGRLLVRSAREAAEWPVLAPGGGPCRRAGAGGDRSRDGRDLALRIRPWNQQEATPSIGPRHRARWLLVRCPATPVDPIPTQFSQKASPANQASQGTPDVEVVGSAAGAAAQHRRRDRHRHGPIRRTGQGPRHRTLRPGHARRRSHDVRSAASEVFSTVHAYDGIVLRSSVHSRRGGDAVASFDLLIPSARLDDALAAFSDIGPVSSRSDASVDVTAPTVGLEERVPRLAGEDQEPARRARGRRLRCPSGNRWKQSCAPSAIGSPGYGPGSTPCSVAPTFPGSPCGSSRTRTAAARAPGASATPTADAARILGIAAGVTLIGLAVLAPIALIVLLGWAAQRAWVRRSRERVLD